MLQTIAEAHGASPRQVALAFLTRDPIVFAIPKASSAEHAADNAAAGDCAERRAKWPHSTRRFRAGRSRAACRCCSAQLLYANVSPAAARRRAQSRISAVLFSGLVDSGHLSFFGVSPDSIIPFQRLPSSIVTPPSAAAVRLDSAPLPLPEKKARRASCARARRPAVSRHRADSGLDACFSARRTRPRNICRRRCRRSRSPGSGFWCSR